MPKNKHDNLVLTPFGYDVGSENAYCNYTGNSNGKVIGEFVCDRIYQYSTTQNCNGTDITDEEMTKASCLTKKEIEDYEFSAEAKDFCIYKIGVYGWHISDLVIYDKPRELSEFFYACDKPKGTDCSVCLDHRENKCKAITRPPQSWCYVEVTE
jgi:hypothetical protein